MIYCVAVTRQGARVAQAVASALKGALYLPERLACEYPGSRGYSNIRDFFSRAFKEARGIVCVMACGIVVRGIKDYVESKTKDPAIVVVDERGQFAISLLSGHLGGANSLAQMVSQAIGAQPVITTATDVNGLPALDDVARELSLEISDLNTLRTIHMALLEGQTVCAIDRAGILKRYFGGRDTSPLIILTSEELAEGEEACPQKGALYLVNLLPPLGIEEDNWGVRQVSHRRESTLILRARRLFYVGIGCNSGTARDEIESLVRDTFSMHGLDQRLIGGIASINAKRGEQGLIEAARALFCPLIFFSKEELSKVDVPNPSFAPKKAVGSPSVAEAAALLATQGSGKLIVEKKKSGNCTIAISVVGH